MSNRSKLHAEILAFNARFKPCRYCKPVLEDNELPCRTEDPLGEWTCTRERGHAGPHIACGVSTGHSLEAWDAAGNYLGGTNDDPLNM